MRYIRVYIEGNRKKGPQGLREGFKRFLQPLQDSVEVNWSVNPILCGSRDEVFKDFVKGSLLNPKDLCVLLVDSEFPVAKTTTAREHLGRYWDLKGHSDNACFLMVQAMESWFFADVDAVASYYGQHFRRKAMGQTDDIESISAKALIDRLAKATSDDRLVAGKYHKGRHSGALLRLIDSQKVQERSPHCKRIFVEIPKAVAGL